MLLPALLIAVAGASTEVEIRADGDRVAVRSTATPVSEVLDRLARQLGMKVVYESAPPRQAVTLSMEGRTPAEAVYGILEGLGLNYAVLMDATGTRVQTLMITGAASPSAGPAPSPSRPAPAFVPRPPVVQPRAPELDEGVDVDVEAEAGAEAADEEAEGEEGQEGEPEAEAPPEVKSEPAQPQLLPAPGTSLPAFGANPFPVATPSPQSGQQTPKANASPTPEDK